jgi:hypothetical protein
LARYELAQIQSAKLPLQEVRFAGLAFAARADWTPDLRPRQVSLESLPPFAGAAAAVPVLGPPNEPAGAEIEKVVASLAAAPIAVLARTDVTNADGTMAIIAHPIPVPRKLPIRAGRDADAIEPAVVWPARRLVYAALALSASDAASFPSIPVFDATRVEIAEPIPASVQEPLPVVPTATPALQANVATVIAALETIPLTEVKPPQPRPRIAHPRAARPKPSTPRRGAANASRRQPPPARPAAPGADAGKNPFSFLFGEPNTLAAPKN